jgi:hypothetical protein
LHMGSALLRRRFTWFRIMNTREATFSTVGLAEQSSPTVFCCCRSRHS